MPTTPSTWDYEREETHSRAAEGNAGVDPGLAQGTTPTVTPSFARVDPDPRRSAQRLPAAQAALQPGTPPRSSRRSPGFRRTSSSRSPRSSGRPGRPTRSGSIVYAVGLTHHTSGVQMIRASASCNSCSGNVGRPGRRRQRRAGPRQHPGQHRQRHQSWEILPGYLAIPRPGIETIADYLDTVPAKQLRPNSINYFGTNYRKFLVSLLKAFFGDRGHRRQRLRASRWIPKPDKNSSWMTVHDEALAGRLHGLINSGMSRASTIGPDSNRVSGVDRQAQVARDHGPVPDRGLRVLARAGGRSGEHPDRGASSYRPRTGSRSRARSSTRDAGPSGSTPVLAGRRARSATTTTSSPSCYLRLGGCTRRRAARFPDPILNLTWPYSNPVNPRARRARQGDQRRRPHHGPAAVDVQRPARTTAPPASGNWLYCGSWTEEGNHDGSPRHRRPDRASGSSTTGPGPGPLNRRVLYNRASADADGKPWDPTRPGIVWNGVGVGRRRS